MANILIVDDDKNFSYMLCRTLVGMGHNADVATTIKQGKEKLSSEAFDVVFLDVRMPDGLGPDLLPTIKAQPSSPEVIIVTSYSDPDGAELVIRSGAWDYIEKPSSLERMTLPLIRALQYRAEKATMKQPVVLRREEIIGKSTKLHECIELLAQAAGTDSNVLITGETGTGKELFAKAIHENSPRKDKSFVVVDCTALPENLVEGILFGHEKGAFTGADRARDGLIKQAHRGTLFLDEIGELPPCAQKAFLRVLQERKFRPIGGNREIESDFRLISATNRNLDQMISSGQFRADLLFRIRTIGIDLPPLRERSEDIPEIALYHIMKMCRSMDIGPRGISPEFLEMLRSYNWPGNIRELIGVLERALIRAQDEPVLFPKHLSTRIRVQVTRATLNGDKMPEINQEMGTDVSDVLPRMSEVLKNTETEYLKDLMSATEGNIKEACRISGISRSRLYARLKKYNISRRPSIRRS